MIRYDSTVLANSVGLVRIYTLCICLECVVVVSNV